MNGKILQKQFYQRERERERILNVYIIQNNFFSSTFRVANLVEKKKKQQINLNKKSKHNYTKIIK